METLQIRREWQGTFQVMRTRSLQPRLLSPARLSIKMEGQIRSCPDKRRLKEYSSIKQALQDILKGLLQEDEEKEQGIEILFEKNNDRKLPNLERGKTI